MSALVMFVPMLTFWIVGSFFGIGPVRNRPVAGE